MIGTLNRIHNAKYLGQLVPCLFLVLLLQGCIESSIYREEHVFEKDIWIHDESVEFPFEVTDTSLFYDLFIELEHSVSYGYQNIYLQIKTVFPNDTSVVSPMPFDLARKDGLWYGKCRGQNCMLTVYLEEGFKFYEPGPYRISFLQHTRDSELEGIKGISLILKKHKS